MFEGGCGGGGGCGIGGGFGGAGGSFGSSGRSHNRHNSDSSVSDALRVETGAKQGHAAQSKNNVRSTWVFSGVTLICFMIYWFGAVSNVQPLKTKESMRILNVGLLEAELGEPVRLTCYPETDACYAVYPQAKIKLVDGQVVRRCGPMENCS